MEIIAADSGGAILNQRFEPVTVVAANSVLVKPPYRTAAKVIAEPIFASAEEGYGLIVHELELCQQMLKQAKADVVHLDMSFGGLAVEELSPIQFSNMKMHSKRQSFTLKILPKIRKLGTDIKRVHGIDVLAIGKESVPVRIAELTAGAHAVVYTAQKVLEDEKPLTLGLPIRCSLAKTGDTVMLQSQMPAEHDISGYAQASIATLDNVEIFEFPNPYARGFRALTITPKQP